MKNYKHVFERVMVLAGSDSDELKALLWLLFLRFYKGQTLVKSVSGVSRVSGVFFFAGTNTCTERGPPVAGHSNIAGRFINLVCN